MILQDKMCCVGSVLVQARHAMWLIIQYLAVGVLVLVCGSALC